MPESFAGKTIRAALRSAALGAALFATNAAAEPAVLAPEWLTRVPAGGSLSTGVAGMVVDGAGTSYITGTSGTSSNADITTAAIASDGSVLWMESFDGPENGGDQARGIVLGPDGILWVTGNTPGPGSWAQVLVLGYDSATGTLVRTILYSSGPQRSEHGASIAAGGAGRVFVAGGTGGDGSDALIVAFDSEGAVLWQRTWDGPAWGPYSQDHGQEILLDPAGNPVVRIHGVMASNHPDYVTVKYDAGTGATLWQSTWGVNGGDFPSDMEIDAKGDVFVTGTGIQLIDKYSTIKIRGTDGGLLWQAYDSVFNDHAAAALTLDGRGGVYVTGSADPEGNHSNFNDDIFTVKRDASSGALLWTHRYGLPCVGCYDIAADVIVDRAGHVYVAGSTSSPPYSSDAILLVLDAATGQETDRAIIAGAAGEGASSRELRFDPQYGIRLAGQMANFDTGAMDMTVAKFGALSASACLTSSRSLCPPSIETAEPLRR